MFGVSAFFFDKYEGPVYHTTQTYAKSPTHFGMIVKGIGGSWAGRYGGIDAVLPGLNYKGIVPDNSGRFILNRDEFDYYLNEKVNITFGGDRWFCYGSGSKNALANPNTDIDEAFAVHAAGAPLNMKVSGLPDGKPYQFTIYTSNDTNKWFDANKVGEITLTFKDVEGDIIFVDTLSSKDFNNGAYVSYVMSGDFTMETSKTNSMQYFGFSGFFFDEVATNFTSNLKVTTGEGNRTAKITWKETKAPTGSRVIIERKHGDEEWKKIAEVSKGKGEYIDTELFTGDTYQYRVYTVAGVRCSYIGDEVTYKVPSYTQTVMTMDKKVYACSSNETEMTVHVQLTTADGKPCAGVPVYLKLDFGHAQQIVPMVHEPEILTDAEGKAAITFKPRYMGEATMWALSYDNDANKWRYSVSEPADLYVGETVWATAPTVYRYSDAVTPGDLISINGYGFTNADMGKLQIVYAPHTSAEVPEKPVESAEKMPILDVDTENGYFITTRLPDDAEPGLYDIWVNNGYGWSETIVLNAPRPLFCSDYETWAGLTVHMSGRGLQSSQFGADAKTIVRLVNGDEIYYPRITKLTPYSIDFVVQEDVPLATYVVEVSNDGGVTWVGLENQHTLTVLEVGDDPLGVGVAWVDHFNWDNRFDVTDYGADGTDKRSDVAAFNKAITAAKESGGGVVYIPDGTYYITQIKLPSYIVLLGESKENTIISYSGRNWAINMFSGRTEDKEEGHLGFANFTITTAHPTFRPDFFFWVGEDWSVAYDTTARKASCFLFYNIHLTYPNTPNTGSSRACGIAVVGQERCAMINCSSDCYGQFVGAMKLTQYNLVKNGHFVGEKHNFYTSANYSFIFDSYLAGHMGEYEDWEYTNGRNVHGFCCAAYCHMEGNTVEKIGSTTEGDLANVQNDGETYLSEVQSTLNYGYVTASTANSITVRMTSGELTETIDVPYNYAHVVIVSGKGMGQMRQIKSINVISGVITIEGTWDVLPDATSGFDFVVPSEGTTFYDNVQRHAAKGVYLYGNMFDTVVSKIHSEDTEGVLVMSSTTMGTSSRMWLNYYCTVRDNYFTGVSPKSKHCNIALTGARNIDGGNFTNVGVYSIEIRNNTMVGTGELKPYDEVYYNPAGIPISRTESPHMNGIGVSYGGNPISDGVSGDVSSIIVEDNYLADMPNGITVDQHCAGFVIDNNTFKNVENPVYHDLEFQEDKTALATGVVQLTDTDGEESLEQLIAHYEDINAELYCEESVAVVQAAIQEAKGVLENGSDYEIDAATRKLRAAYTALNSHLWNEGVVTKEATETKLGEMTYTCTGCGITKTETIQKDALGSSSWVLILVVSCVVVAAVVVAGVLVVKKKKVKS